MMTTREPRQAEKFRGPRAWNGVLIAGLELVPSRLLRCLGVLVIALLCAAGGLQAQTQTPPPTDVIGMHDLSPQGSSPVKGRLGGSCLYCHAPHGGVNGAPGVVVQTPLWDQKLSSVPSYPLYSGAMTNTTISALKLGSNSTLCLSCHDGSVAGSPGALVPYGNVPISGPWNPGDILGTNLSSMHPINFKLPLQAAANLVTTLTNSPPTTDDLTGAVKLIDGNVQCGTCHNPHKQNTDPNGYFLVLNNTGGKLCLACHSTVPPGSGMGLQPEPPVPNAALHAGGTALARNSVASKVNSLAGWTTSIHALASNRVPTQITVSTTTVTSTGRLASKAQSTLGPYGSVANNACSSCHVSHNAQGDSLLRAADDQACVVCHNGSSNVSPPVANILAETIAPKYGHAFTPGNSPHMARETVLMNQNRHVTCVDCHNPHTANRVASFPSGTGIRLSQAQVLGISATDGKSVVSPAANQYENCLRCHGTSPGKQVRPVYGYLPVWAVAATDPLNVIPQFALSASSSHPVFHDSNSPYPQPSLRTNMLQLDGITLGRAMGTRILCTDCHNSDDNREFGGSGPSGPHGSIFPHILERRYEFSQASAPGKLITNLFPDPSLSAQGGAAGGPYALCAKCHDLNKIMTNTSFNQHALHIQSGFSCSVCHTAHGMGAQSGSITGQRLVNFDIRVVAPNGANPIAYNRATNSCSLVCHNYTHQLAGVVAAGAKARVR